MKPNLKTKAIVIIDGAVENYPQLLNGVIPGVKSFVLDGDRDGILQIADILQGHPETDTVHLISHGSPGCLYLGDARLSLDTLKGYASQLQQWNLDNFLLYGCNVAAGDGGEEFVTKLHQLTGARIAASKSLTGAAVKGGNWELEARRGKVELAVAFTREAMGSYQGVLMAEPVLVKTITLDPDALLFPLPSLNSFANVNDTLYFAVRILDGGFLQNYLWKSDGTEAGTVLVKDINPTGNANLWNLTNFNDTLYFRADDGSNGLELWKSDGTEAGTVQVKDINPGRGGSKPGNLTKIDDTLYFTANGQSNLWKSDGTEAGTVQVKDINLAGDPPLYNLTNVNGTLYFTAYDHSNSNHELWKSDGTEAGTVLVKDFDPVTSSFYFIFQPRDLTNVNGTLYFSVRDGSNGYDLWKSDGTEAGTVQVKDINPGPGGSWPRDLTNVNGTLYFTANDGSNGSELWKSDGTEAGTVLFKDINPTGSDSVGGLTKINNTLYFTANDGSNGSELWKSDGTEAGTVLVKDINPAGSSGPSNFTNVNGTLYFTANDGSSGTELWKSDGTEAGTVLVGDFNPGSGDSSFPNLTNFNGDLYFTGRNDSRDLELWKLVANSPPTDLELSNRSIDENVAAGTTVGNFSTTDPDTGDTFTYTLVAGTGDTDNAAFTINGDQLQINNSPDFETQSRYSIRVQTTDAEGETYQKRLRIRINDIIEGTDRNDILRGTDARDNISGIGGNDRLYGEGGNDTISGGTGTDIIYGGTGKDILDGGPGRDRLYGNAGNDTISGGDGDDLLYGGAGKDILDGGLGNDRLYGNAGNDTFVLASGMGRDRIYRFEDGTDTIQLGGSLSFSDLEISASGSSTLIKVAATGESLALLPGINSALIGAADFEAS